MKKPFKFLVLGICLIALILLCYLHYFKQSENNQSPFMKRRYMKYMKNPQKTICKDVKLAKKPLPAVGLVSFPGSGNTWTRQLIQEMTGLGTSSIYCDGTIGKSQFPFECFQKGSIVIKSHKDDISSFKKVVLILRNPHEAFMAYFNFHKGFFQANLSSTVLLKAKQEVFRKSLKWYKDIAVSCLKDNNKPVHILQYEKLKTNLSAELHSLATFLNVPVTPEDVKCAVDNCRGQYYRQASLEHRIKQINEVFTSEDFLEIDQLQRDIESLLHERFKRTFDLTSELIKLRRNIYSSV